MNSFDVVGVDNSGVASMRQSEEFAIFWISWSTMISRVVLQTWTTPVTVLI